LGESSGTVFFIDLLFLGKGVRYTSPRQSVPPFWKCVVVDVKWQGFAMLWCYSATGIIWWIPLSLCPAKHWNKAGVTSLGFLRSITISIFM